MLLARQATATTCGVTTQGDYACGGPNIFYASVGESPGCVPAAYGNVTSLAVWLATGVTNGHLKCSLFTGCNTGTCVKVGVGTACDTASTTVDATPNKLWTMAVSGTCPVVAGTTYWIGCNNDNASIAYECTNQAGGIRYNLSQTYPALSPPAQGTNYDAALSLYFNYDIINTPTVTSTSTRTATTTVTATRTNTVVATPTATPTRTPGRGGPQAIEELFPVGVPEVIEQAFPVGQPELIEAPPLPGQVPMLIDDETAQFPRGHLSLIDDTPTRTPGAPPTPTLIGTSTPSRTPTPTYPANATPTILAVAAMVAPAGESFNYTAVAITGARFGAAAGSSVQIDHDGTSTTITYGDDEVAEWYDDFIEVTLPVRTTALSATVTRNGYTSGAVVAEVYEFTPLHDPDIGGATSNVIDFKASDGTVWYEGEFNYPNRVFGYDPSGPTWSRVPVPQPTPMTLGYCSGEDVLFRCTVNANCPTSGHVCIHPGTLFGGKYDSYWGEDVHVHPDGSIWSAYAGEANYFGPYPNHTIIMRYDPSTGNKRVYSMPGDANEARGMAWDASRNLWWIGQRGGIVAFDPDTTPYDAQADSYFAPLDGLWCAAWSMPINGCYQFWPDDTMGAYLNVGQIRVAADGSIWYTHFDTTLSGQYQTSINRLIPDTNTIEHYPVPGAGYQSTLLIDPTTGDVLVSDFQRNWLLTLDHTNIGLATCFELRSDGVNPCLTISELPHVDTNTYPASISDITSSRIWYTTFAVGVSGFIGWIDRASGQWVRLPEPRAATSGGMLYFPGAPGGGYTMSSYTGAGLVRDASTEDIWTNDFYHGGLVHFLFRGSTPPPATYTPTPGMTSTHTVTGTVTATPTNTATSTPTPTLQNGSCAYVVVTPSSDGWVQASWAVTNGWPPTPTVTWDGTSEAGQLQRSDAYGNYYQYEYLARFPTGAALPDSAIVVGAWLTGFFGDAADADGVQLKASFADFGATLGAEDYDPLGGINEDLVGWSLTQPLTTVNGWYALLGTQSGDLDRYSTTGDTDVRLSIFDTAFNPAPTGVNQIVVASSRAAQAPYLTLEYCPPTPTSTPYRMKTWEPVNLQIEELSSHHSGNDTGTCCDTYDGWSCSSTKCTYMSDCASVPGNPVCKPQGYCYVAGGPNNWTQLCDVPADCTDVGAQCLDRGGRWDSGVTADWPAAGNLFWKWSSSAGLDSWDGVFWDNSTPAELLYQSTNGGCDALGANCATVMWFPDYDGPRYLIETWHPGETLTRGPATTHTHFWVEEGYHVGDANWCTLSGGCTCEADYVWTMKVEPWSPTSDPPKDNPRLLRDAEHPLIRLTSWQRAEGWVNTAVQGKCLGGGNDGQNCTAPGNCPDGTCSMWSCLGAEQDYFEQYWWGFDINSNHVLAHTRGWQRGFTLVTPPAATSTPNMTPPPGAYPTPPWNWNSYYVDQYLFTVTPAVTATPTATATPTLTSTPAGPLVAIVPSGAVAVLPVIGDLRICAATPAPAPATPGPPYVCVDAAGSPRGVAPVPFGSSAVVPALGAGPLTRCRPGNVNVAFLCRTTPTPGTVRVQVGHVGKTMAFDATGDYAVCGATSPYYLCAGQ